MAKRAADKLTPELVATPNNSVTSIIEYLRTAGSQKRARTLKALAKRYPNRDDGERAGIIAIRPRADRRLTEAVRELLNDESWRVRREAVTLLGRMGAVEAVPEIGASLTSKYGSVRRAAANALIAIGPAELGDILLTGLGATSAKAREDTVEALYQAGVPAIVPLCRLLIADDLPNPDAAKRALMALVYPMPGRKRMLGSVAVLEVLATERLSPREKQSALEVIRRLRPRIWSPKVVGDIPELCRDIATSVDEREMGAALGATRLLDYLTLARAGDPPTDHAATLLRPAGAGSETATDELLRVSYDSDDAPTAPIGIGIVARVRDWLRRAR